MVKGQTPLIESITFCNVLSKSKTVLWKCWFVLKRALCDFHSKFQNVGSERSSKKSSERWLQCHRCHRPGDLADLRALQAELWDSRKARTAEAAGKPATPGTSPHLHVHLHVVYGSRHDNTKNECHLKIAEKKYGCQKTASRNSPSRLYVVYIAAYYIYINACMHACMHVCRYACMHVCI